MVDSHRDGGVFLVGMGSKLTLTNYNFIDNTAGTLGYGACGMVTGAAEIELQGGGQASGNDARYVWVALGGERKQIDDH